jgi:transcriptional regulator with XRE-family HTH domain
VTSGLDGPWKGQLQALGEFIRAQRKLANLSLREMADLTHVSNAYLSQIERGLHEPSVRVLRAVARSAASAQKYRRPRRPSAPTRRSRTRRRKRCSRFTAATARVPTACRKT